MNYLIKAKSEAELLSLVGDENVLGEFFSDESYFYAVTSKKNYKIIRRSILKYFIVYTDKYSDVHSYFLGNWNSLEMDLCESKENENYLAIYLNLEGDDVALHKDISLYADKELTQEQKRIFTEYKKPLMLFVLENLTNYPLNDLLEIARSILENKALEIKEKEIK